MALNDIKVPRENASGTFDEVVLTGTQIGLEKPATGNASSTQVVLGNDTRLSDSRSPSAHAASHAAGGSDPLAPSDIGAQSIFDSSSVFYSSDQTLAVHRARQWTISNTNAAGINVTLPSGTDGSLSDDIYVIRGGSTMSGPITIRHLVVSSPQIYETLATISATGQQYRFRSDGASTGNWSLVAVDTHTHAASAISDSTTAGRALLTGADAAAQRTSLGLGTAATSASGDFAAASHSHGNINSSGQVGSDSGRVLVTTTAGAVTTLALGTAGQVLTVNSGANGVEFAAASGGGVSSVSSSASDVLGVSGANITGVDANADRIVFWDDSASKLAYLEAGSGLSLSGTTLTATATGTIGGSTGATDNVILRADGTGGSTSQGSALLIEDEVLAFTSITGDAGTDIITATGSAFANGQRVRFTALTGGSGLNTTTNYFVIGASGATFQLSTTEGGSASLFTTNITAGTLLTGHSVDRHVAITNNSSGTNSALWIKTKGSGAFIVDGTGSLATARGAGAIDIQPERGTNSSRVASGVLAIAIGDNATASNTRSICIGSNGSVASGANSVALGAGNTASARGSVAMGLSALADRSGRAFCHHSNSASGHRQELQFLLTRTTTNDTAVEMWADEYESARVTIPSGKVMGGVVCVTGSKSDGSAVALYTRQFVIKNVGGTTTMPSQSTIGTDYEDNASTDITVEANDTNDALRVLVKGISGETWRWTGWLHCTEHFYGT